jgi:uncharacterized protein DUF6789
MAATNGVEAKQALRGGAAAGAIAGAVLSVFMTVMSLVKGNDIWSNVFKGAAAPFIGDAAYEPGFAFGPVALGIVCHFAVSIVWGLAFGLIVYGFSKPMTMLVSALWGIVVWLGMFYVLLPLVGLREMTDAAPVAAGVIYHVVFGLAMGVAFLPFQRPHHVVLGSHVPAHGH